MTEHPGNPGEEDRRYEEFLALFARHEAGLRAFVRSLLPTRADIDEVVQESCLVLWRKFADFEPGGHFMRWACTIARFEVLKYRRRLSRDRHVFDAALLELLADDAVGQLDRLEQERRVLDGCLEKLPAHQRELVRGCYAGDRTIKEAADQLGRSATAVYKALNRVRLVLLDCVRRTLADEGAT